MAPMAQYLKQCTNLQVRSFIRVSNPSIMLYPLTGEVVAIKHMKRHFNSWSECVQLREVKV